MWTGGAGRSGSSAPGGALGSSAPGGPECCAPEPKLGFQGLLEPAVHWSEVGDPRAPDTALMQWALDNAYAVFTHDLDLGTMLALSGASGPSVLEVRCLNVLPEAIGPLVLALLIKAT